MKNEKAIWLEKPWIKNVILGILTVIIGAGCSLLWIEDGKFFILVLVITLIVTFLYIGALIFYGTREVNTRRINEIQTGQISVFEDLMIKIISICKSSASGVNHIIHNIEEKGQIELDIWSFDRACTEVCKSIYDTVCKIGSGSKDFSVSYIRLDESVKPEQDIFMNAYANQNMSKPSVFMRKRRFDKKNDQNYYDIRLFQENKSDINILPNRKEVNEAFQFTTRESRNRNTEKYNQFIAIPVFCDDAKMIGLVEVACLKEATLGLTKKEIEENTSKYLVPYSFLFLLLHKMERALMARPHDQPIAEERGN